MGGASYLFEGSLELGTVPDTTGRLLGKQPGPLAVDGCVVGCVCPFGWVGGLWRRVCRGRVLCGGTPVLVCLSLTALVLLLLSWRGLRIPLLPSGVTASYLYPLYGLLAVLGERPRVNAVYPFIYPFPFRCYPLSSCWFFSLLCALVSSFSPPWRDFSMSRGCFSSVAITIFHPTDL